MNSSEQILYISFNQDQGCFACGTENGFKIFNSQPFTESFSRDLGGGIGIIEMLYRCNIIALVGGGKNPKYTTTKVILWDDHSEKSVGEMSFRTEVQAVKLTMNRINVLLENRIFIYSFSDFKLIEYIETFTNPRGLCSISTIDGPLIYALPYKELGHVLVKNEDEKSQAIIKAHKSSLSALELTSSGDKLATASEKGTIIRIFDTKTKQLIQELRRGKDVACIFSVSFHQDGKWLACSSDRGTIHIFCLKTDQQQQGGQNQEQKMEPKNKKATFKFLGGLIPYFNSEWSFAYFKIEDQKPIVAFGADSNSIVIATYEGNYYTATFDSTNGGECQKKESFLLIQSFSK